MLILLLVFLVLGLVTALISVPLIARRVEPNLIYGFRVRRTLENRALWLDVNEFFGWRLLVTSIVQILASFCLYVVPGISVEAYTLSVLVAFAVVFSLGMNQTMRFLNSWRE